MYVRMYAVMYLCLYLPSPNSFKGLGAIPPIGGWGILLGGGGGGLGLSVGGNLRRSAFDSTFLKVKNNIL